MHRFTLLKLSPSLHNLDQTGDQIIKTMEHLEQILMKVAQFRLKQILPHDKSHKINHTLNHIPNHYLFENILCTVVFFHTAK